MGTLLLHQGEVPNDVMGWLHWIDPSLGLRKCQISLNCFEQPLVPFVPKVSVLPLSGIHAWDYCHKLIHHTTFLRNMQGVPPKDLGQKTQMLYKCVPILNCYWFLLNKELSPIFRYQQVRGDARVHPTLQESNIVCFNGSTMEKYIIS